MNALTEAISNLAVAAAAVAALIGINAWRREVVGRRKIELAEEVLSLVYEAKDIVKWMRFPGSSEHEASAREREEGESEAQRNARDRVYPTIKRFNDGREIFSRLEAIRYRFAAYFGPSTLDLFRALRRIPDGVLIRARTLARLYEEAERGGRREERLRKRIMEREEVIWGSDDDKISQELESVVEKFEAVCRPVLRGR